MQIAPHSNATQPLPLSTVPSAIAQADSSNASSAASNPSSNPGTSTATITANDFLQLLVTELQNQDPTANTDPNEYVNQLVQVNTLQQQIQMNQTLDGGPTLTGGSSGVLQELGQIDQALEGDLSSGSPSAQVTRNASPDFVASGKETTTSTGNLSAPENAQRSAAAEAVATALARSSHSPIPGVQGNAFEQFAAHLKSKLN